MPKRVANDLKHFRCQWCPKSYAHASGKSAHEKSAHRDQYNRRNLNRIPDSYIKVTTSNFNTQSATDMLKQRFMNDEIDSEEYKRLCKAVKTRAEQKGKNQVKAELDLGKMVNKDYTYIFGYLFKMFGSEGIDTIITKLIEGEYLHVFLKVFSGQLYHYQSDIGEDMFEWACPTQPSTETVEVNLILIRDLMTGIIYSIFKNISTFGDQESNIISNENISDGDIRRIKALATFDTSNRLMQSACFDPVLLLQLIQHSFDQFHEPLIME